MKNEPHLIITETPSTRNSIIDSMKGLAIIFVVWGHSIQFVKKDSLNFFDNPLFITIYSFHMPFFMLLSGYLFYFSLKRKASSIIKRKFMQLIIPSIAWFIAESIFVGRDINLINIRYGAIYAFWFLSALFAVSIVYTICHSISKQYSVVLYLLIFSISLAYGDDWNMDKIKFMAPYFIAGISAHRILDFASRNRHKIGVLAVLTWIGMLLLWNREYYIYISKMTYENVDFWHQSFIIIFRYFIGFAGSISLIYAYTFLSTKNNLFIRATSFVGTYTFPIYIISSFIFYRIEAYVNINNLCENPLIYNLIITPSFVFLIVTTCIIVARLLKTNKYTSHILLGGRKI